MYFRADSLVDATTAVVRCEHAIDEQGAASSPATFRATKPARRA